MNIRYYTETDTLYIEFRDVAVAETRDLDENTLLDLDDDGSPMISTISASPGTTFAGPRICALGMCSPRLVDFQAIRVPRCAQS